MTPERLEQLLKRQLSDVERRRRADFIVDTSGTIAQTEAQIDVVIDQLVRREGTAFERFWS
jgi:dephospho-CoA kinase